MPRAARSKLSQWRSSYSPDFNHYLNRIDSENIEDKCPKCTATPHDIHHQFKCPSAPTNLTPLDLWTKPKKCAEFFKLGDGVT